MKVFGEERINSFVSGNQSAPAVTALTGGGYVMTWISDGQDGSGEGIYAQRLDANGIGIGPEFRVNTTVGGTQTSPVIASLSDGGFVVVWSDYSGADGSGYGLFAQRYNAAGTAQGNEFRINTTTSSTQYQPNVSAFNGGFVVTWSSSQASPGDANGYGVFGTRFNNAGSVLQTGGQNEFQVNTYTTGHQWESDVAAYADGRYVVAWLSEGQEGDGYSGVYAQRYSSSGAKIGSEFHVNTYTANYQFAPRIATLSDGGFVVVWTSRGQDGGSDGVYGQRYDAAGNAAGGEFRVNVATDYDQGQPDVIGLSTGGFVVSWYSYYVPSENNYYEIYTREYDTAGAPVTGEQKVNTYNNSSYQQTQPALADLGNGNYVVAWSSDNQDGSGQGIYQQLFGDTADFSRQANPALGDFGGTVTFAENLVNTGLQVLDAAVSLGDTDSANFDGGRIELYFVKGGSVEDRLGVVHEGNAAGQVGVSGNTVSYGGTAIGTTSGGLDGAVLTINLNTNASVNAVEQLIQRLGYGNNSSSPAASRDVGIRVSDGDGGSTFGGIVTVNVTRELDGTPAAHGEERVNTYTVDHQQTPNMATLTDGSYVVTWISNLQDGSSWGVYAQRFSGSGAAIGPEFRVNTLTGGQQDWPHVAGLSNGGFVITWQDSNGNDGSGWGVYGQRYDAAGAPAGSQFLINTHTNSAQYHDNVAAYTGGFATVWSSTGNSGGNGQDIYVQRWDNNGNKVAGEVLVSTTPGASTAQAGNQYVPDIAAHANGNLFVTWTDDSGSDGSGNAVYGRFYNAGSATWSATLLVNTTTAGNQSYGASGEYEANVATLSDGGFVVVWPSDSNDGSGWAVMGQRFNASGQKVGGEFQVNESASGSQYQTEVIGLSTGGFVVGFYHDSISADGSSTYYDAYIREFNASGVPVDGERKVNTYNGGNYYQGEPALTDLGNGNYAVAWTSQYQDGSGSSYGIYQQLFGDIAELPRSSNPDLSDFTGTVTFAENTVNAGLQVIDAAVSLTDGDSANFNGGRLDLYFLTGQAAEDQLGVVHQGNGAGQIGVSGTTVSYGGAVIGTLSGGGNGGNLRIDFTSNAATPDAVEALVQRLGYANTDSSPNASRSLGLRIADGDGGSSAANVLTINVTPQLDGTPAAYGESQVHTYTPDHQQTPNMATLTDGSYVVTWNSNLQDGSSWGVYAQRFSGSGAAIGPEFRVNTLTGGEQSWPHVAGLSNGGFVITWQDSNGNDGSSWGVYGQRYDAAGAPAGSQFLINTHASSTQYHDNVAAYTGGFATVWSSNGNSGGNGQDIYVQRWDNNGNKVAGEVLVSTTPGAATAQAGNQYVPDIAAHANGNLFVTWTDDSGSDGSGNAVYGRFYNAGSATWSASLLVNTTTAGNQSYGASGEYEANVATLSDGGFVVVWPSDGNDGSGWAVMGQRFNASGQKVGGEFQVNESASGSQYQTEVIGLSTGGFVVGFYSNTQGPDGTYYDAYIREFNASGVPVDGERKVNTYNGSNDYQGEPALTDLGNGNYAVAWTSQYQDGSGSSYGIYQQLFGDIAELPRSSNPDLSDFTGTVIFAENTVNAGLQVIDAAVSLTDSDSANFNGGRLDLYFLTGQAAEDQLGVVHQGNGAGQIGVSGTTVSYGGAVIGTLSGGSNGGNLRIDFTSNAATPDAVEALVQRLGYANTDSSPNASRSLGLRIADGDGGSSVANVLTINVTPDSDGTPAAYGEEQVNTYTAGTQEDPEVARLSSGGYVVAWTSSGQDGSVDGVYAQRFNASGIAVGPEFKVNAATTSYQQYAKVAGLSDGGFVITWQDNNGSDGSGWGVIGQRYDANGVAQGSNFIVNSVTSSSQYHDAVTAYAGDGAGVAAGFTAVWSSLGNAGGSSFDIWMQRFDNAGTRLGGEVLVSTNPGLTTAQTGNQQLPDVAAHANGDLVIVWQDESSQDGNGYGVYARTYDASAGTFGSTFLVNSVTSGNQYEARVATLANGGFVVVWGDSSAVDGSGWGTYARRYDASGVAQGNAFLVNENTSGSQYQPTVTGLSTGGFVVSFHNDANPDGQGDADVWIREYDALGNVKDGDQRVNTVTASAQYQPVLEDLGNGNFVVVWSGYVSTADGGNNTYEIRQQLFGDTAELPRSSANPVLDDLSGTRTLGAAQAITPQIIDADVWVADSDSANFDGGSLWVYFTSGRLNPDTLGINNEGAGALQIGVSGSNVTYGGTVIGTLTGGSAGAPLVVTFNASATPVAVRQLLENITYQYNDVSAPNGARTVAFRLFDGDGGASTPASTTITIQATAPAATLTLTDLESSVTFSETVAQLGVVVDENVAVTQGANPISTLTVSYVSSSGRPEDQLAIRNQGTGSEQVGFNAGTGVVSYEGVAIGTVNAADTGANGDTLVINFNAAASVAAVERVIENLRYQTTSDGPLASRTIQVQITDSANATASQNLVINITPEDDGVQALFADEQVNTYQPGDQWYPRVSALEGVNAGSYVVVWRSPTEDGDSTGIFAQRYNAAGVQVGTEFQVNTYTSDSQSEPVVVSLANGGFVVVWRSEGQDGSSGGVYAQRYDANGLPAGNETQVSLVTANDQTHATVVGLADGSYVVAWADAARDTSSYGSFAQRFAADGTRLGAEFQLNTYLPNQQYLPTLAALKNDPATVEDETGFVAVWESNAQDGSSWGIYAQRFSSAGAKVGGEFKVNTTVANSQVNPDVAVLSNTHFVVVWHDDSTSSVRAQLYTAAGVTIGGEIVVSSSDFDSNYGQWPHVTALQSGGFVVNWDGHASPSDSGYGVYAQQFDANGNKVDGPFSLNSNTANNQHYPDVAALGGDKFVAVWMSNYQESDGNNSHGIFQRLFGTPGSIVRQASPELLDLESGVSFNENAVNAGAQLIDPGVRVVDADSANFDGGRLVVSVLTGYGAAQAFDPLAFQQDHFSIRNQGNGGGQVGFNAGVVSYAGTAIGTLVSNGQNGADLVVQFNGNATASAVEAVIENLTYRNSASNPTASRLVSVVVSDGDGGQSAPRTLTIDVVAQTDGAVALLGEDQRVNTYTASNQEGPVIAALQGGNAGQYVVVWESNGQDSDGWGVFAQRYDVNGSAIGPEFQVNSYTPGTQHGYSLLGVAGLSTGGFVVTWDSDSQDGSLYGVYAQRYGADGQPVGGEFLVNTATNYHHQFQAQALGLNDGKFVIAYTDYQNADGNDYGVRLQHYDAAGIAQGSPFTVNTFVTNNQSFAQLAKLNDGGYVVVWHSLTQDGSDWSVQARLMNADGTPRSGEFQVNTYTSNNQSNADVAVLNNGDFVVSWLSNNPGLGGWSIMAQRFSATGTKIGAEVLVNDGVSAPGNGDTYSRIATLNNGGYVVTWSDSSGVSGYDAYAQQFDAAGNKVDAPLLLNSYTSNTQYRPDVAGLTGDRWVAAWQSYGQDGDVNGIYQNLFGPTGSLTKSAAPVIGDLAASVTVLENTANQATGVLIDPSISLADSDSVNFDGGRLIVSTISGYNSLDADLSQNLPTQDHFSVRHQGNGAGQVGFNAGTGAVSYGGVAVGNIVSGFNGQNGGDLIIQFNAQASVEAVEAVIENLSYRNSSSDPKPSRLVSITVSDGDGSTSAPRTVQINVTAEADGGIPLFSAEQVNTYTTSTQSRPAMAELADGGYVILWQSNGQDGWDYGVFGQRYAADGTRVGNEFRVSDYTPYNQTEVAVTGLNAGGFVAVYRGQYRDASGDAIVGQRFDAAGQKVGGEFLVNTTADGAQYSPKITALADGGFAVAWKSDGGRDGEYYDIFFQRFDSAGAAVGQEIRANTPISGQPYVHQYEPAISQLSSGDILLAWGSEGQDGSNSGVYAQRFSSTGSKLGSEFQINTYTNDYQYAPSITPTATGFVAVWVSRGQDSSGDGIYARLFNNNGTPASAEFRVNDTYSNGQYAPQVATLANGGFVVTWYDNNNSHRILAQQYDAAGNRIDGELQLDGTTNSDQDPAVVALSNGNFAVSWWGYYDASDSGIFQRLIGNPADFPRQSAPEIVDLVSSVTFLENVINDTPQLIDPGVGLVDPDSSNFAGGRLDVSYVTPYGNADQFDIPGINAQDQLGIRNEGTGVEQIGVSGSNVTYNFGAGAVVIGSLVSNGVNGRPLTVLFNANANAAAAEALIENLTYANPLSNPEPTRTISLSLSDGDGGVTPPKAITINITAQPDGASPFGAEKVVNSTLTGTQQNPAIAYLSNGNYVVVWQDESGQDGNSHGVYARVYDSNDNPLGIQFQVNTTTANAQTEPSVVALQGGGFTVAWAGYNQVGSSTAYDIVGRSFNNVGTATSAEFVINNPSATYVNYEQNLPELAALQNGGFVAVWYGVHDQADNSSYEIWGQRFTSAGAKDGSVFKVNTSTGFESSFQHDPSVATLADGHFVVVWRSDNQDGSSAGVFGQRFNANGTKDGTEFRANTYTANGQYQQDVAALNDGGYVVVWGSDSSQDTSGWGVYGQRFDAGGNAVGGEFRVNYTVSGTQYIPAVTALANGGFVVSWTDGDEIWFQQYNAAGLKVDSQQAVNAESNYSYSSNSDLVGTPDGGFLITYDGYNYGNSTYDIFLQRYSNVAPQVQDVSVIGPEDAPIILTDELFASGFSDAEGQTLSAIKIVTLPVSGALKLNGVAVTAGQIIGIADLAANKLTYQGNANYYGPDQFRWNGSDGNVFATTSVFTNITVNNVNDGPGLEAGANQTANEGTFFSHTITLGDPDLADIHLVTVSWVGSGGQTGGYNFSTGSNNPALNLTLPDNGSYTVTVTANDQQGQANSIETDSFTVTVNNVAPTLPNISGNNTVVQGQAYTLDLGPVSDPGTDTVSEYRIDWGDGTPVQTILAANLPPSQEVTHTYANSGSPTIHVALVDEDGTHANAGNKTITVSPPAEVIVVDAGADTSIGEGTLFNRSISFTDPADQDPAGRNVSVDWGDGTGAQNFRIGAGATTFNIQHVFADNRATPYTVNVTVDDDGFQADSDSFLVTVNDVAPTLSLGGGGITPEGSVYTLTLGTVNDPGADTVTAYVVHWGDGNNESFLAGNLPASREVQHVYADGDVSGTPRTITVDLVNEDGTFLNAGSKSLTVTNVAPSATLSGNANVNEGAVYTLNVSGITDPGVDTPTLYRINWGDGSQTDFTPSAYAALLAAGGNATHVYADGSPAGVVRNIALQVLDEDGTHNAGSKSVTVNDVAPTLALAGAASVDEGSSYTLTLGAVTDPGSDTISSYVVNWGDGSTDTYGSAGNVTHIYADGAANRTISVSLVDEDGTHNNAGSKTITVNDVAPTIALAGAATVVEDTLYTLTLGAVTDPGSDTASSYVVHWGDGSNSSYPAGGNVTHIYANPGNYNIIVDLVDEDGTHAAAGSKAVAVDIASATLSVNVGADTSSNEGDTFTRSIAFSDGADNGAPGWSYSIDYGDGSAVASGTTLVQSLNLSHQYADGNANRTVTVTLTDVAGETASDSLQVTVNDVAPAIALAGAASVDEGSSYTLTLGAVTDPGSDTVASYLVNWGDGTSNAYASAGNVSHIYADGAANRTISVSLVDEDGTHNNAGSKTITVNDVAPTLALAGAASVDEGSSYTLTLGAVTDPGSDTISSYVVNWGDGSTDTYGSAGNVTHIYADGAANRTISVSLVDEDGTHNNAGSKTITVNDVAPTIALAGAATVVEDTLYTLTLGAVTDPGSDTASSYVVHWGDGSNSSYPAGGNVTHIYANPGNYNIIVDLVDEDGTHAAAGSKAVAVDIASATLSVNVGADTSSNEGDTFTRSIAFSDGADNGAPGWSYSIDYGDGSAVASGTTLVQSLNLSHQYADGNANRTVTVTLTDVAGETASDSLQVTVNDVAPAIALAGAASVDEGSSYTLTLGAVTDPGSDTVASYLVNWGDGTSNAYASAGNVSHIYADGAANRTISVSLVDEDGTHNNAGSKTITVNDVAPTITLSGAPTVAEDKLYTLTLGTVTDPGSDTASSFMVHWGDGTSNTYANAGNVSHSFGNPGSYSISVDIIDEDGLHSSAGQLTLQVNQVISIGNAVTRLTSSAPNAWETAWSAPEISLQHKADWDNAGENWSAVKLLNGSPLSLAGTDVYLGDLGVSGQTLPTSVIRQEIDGSEGLRLLVDHDATRATLDFSYLNINDDRLTGAFEAGRVQAFDENGQVVGEVLFHAGNTAGTQEVTISAAAGFRSLVITTGAYDGVNFVDGAYVDAQGNFTSGPLNSLGSLHGSDFLVDSVEFEAVPLVGIGTNTPDFQI